MKHILKKFKIYKNKICEYSHWIILLREEQVTIGSLVLIEKSFKKKLSDISIESYKQLQFIVKNIEQILKKIFKYEKINYLILMMVDKEVHIHVIPRYKKKKVFNNTSFYDLGWPKIPNFSKTNKINTLTRKKIISLIKSNLKTNDIHRKK